MRELSLHLLDIAENSISAGASRIVISVREDLVADELWLEVSDNGKGMSPDMVEKVLDPLIGKSVVLYFYKPSTVAERNAK